ncbi:MAG: CopG family ribbon-helix-helix protein [Phreatobacter sp.]|jgi:predicted transcriptional regulator|uniref:CopG family ribbon-helix-helix protein n=1 Tax=Phreatobacter sp. TaxID=1966341 RepID=UPI004035F66A
MNAITIRLDADLTERLDRLAEMLDRPLADIAADAVAEYVAAEEAEIAKIKEGLEQARRGEFATDEEVAAVVAKYVKPAT